MSLLSWNCRGLKNLIPQNLGFISSIVRSNKLDVIFLSESKSKVFCLEPMFSKLGFVSCTGFDPEGKKGGLFLCWSKNVVVSTISLSKNYVCCSITDDAGNEFYVEFVYGSPYLADQSEIWTNLSTIMDNHKGKWMLVGDFNQVETNNQKLGGFSVT